MHILMLLLVIVFFQVLCLFKPPEYHHPAGSDNTLAGVLRVKRSKLIKSLVLSQKSHKVLACYLNSILQPMTYGMIIFVHSHVILKLKWTIQKERFSKEKYSLDALHVSLIK